MPIKNEKNVVKLSGTVFSNFVENTQGLFEFFLKKKENENDILPCVAPKELIFGKSVKQNDEISLCGEIYTSPFFRAKINQRGFLISRASDISKNLEQLNDVLYQDRKYELKMVGNIGSKSEIKIIPQSQKKIINFKLFVENGISKRNLIVHCVAREKLAEKISYGKYENEDIWCFGVLHSIEKANLPVVNYDFAIDKIVTREEFFKNR